MVDVGVREAAHAVDEERKKIGRGAALVLAVVRPEGAEPPFAAIAEPHAMEVFEAAGEVRIALDVVEYVAVVGGGEQAEALARFRVAQFERRRAAGASRRLQTRLRDQL